MERLLSKFKLKKQNVEITPWYVYDYAAWLPLTGIINHQSELDFGQLKPAIQPHDSINCGADESASGPVYTVAIEQMANLNLTLRAQLLLKQTLMALINSVDNREQYRLYGELPADTSYAAGVIKLSLLQQLCPGLNSYHRNHHSQPAFSDALSLPQGNGGQFVLYGGVDSLIDSPSLLELAKTCQIMSSRNQSGAIASEGAAFVLAGSKVNQASQCMIKLRFNSLEPEAVAKQIEQLFAQLSLDINQLDFIYNRVEKLEAIIWDTTIKQKLSAYPGANFINPHLIIGRPGAATFAASLVIGLQQNKRSMRPQLITAGTDEFILIMERN